MKDQAQTEEAPRIEINSQTTNESKNTDQKSCLRILHVDDDPSILEISKTILIMEGDFEIDNASCVDEALRKIGTQNYDAIISDYEMPQKNGLDFLKEIRQQRNGIPFVLFTGKGERALAMKALNLGADGYYDKQGSTETVYGELVHGVINAVRTRRAEKELRIQREELQSILDSMPVKIWYKDTNNRFVRVNKAFAEYMGVSKENLEGKQLSDLFPPDIAQKCWEEDKEVITTGQPKTDILDRYESAQGVKWVSTGKVPCTDKDGNIIGTINFSVDITERKKMEEALKESEETIRSIIENSSDQIFLLDRDCKFLTINKTAADLFRISPQEMVGMSIFEIFPETIAAQFSKNVKNVFDTGKSMFIDEKMVVKGSELYNSTSLNPVTDDRGRVRAVAGIVRDITEKKKGEEEKSRLLQGLQERTKELNCLYCMSRLFEKSDISLDDALQETADLLPPAMKYPEIACARIVIANREFSTKNFKETRWKLQADIKVLGKKAGSVDVCYLEERPAIAEDPFLKEERHLIGAIAERLGKTTERRKAEKELQESEEKFRAIFEGASDGIIVADLKTRRFVFANPRICEITGYSLREVLRLNVSDIHPEKDLPYVNDQFMKQLQGKTTLAPDIPVLRKDKGVVYCDVNARPVKIGDQEYLMGFFRDVTERKKAEQAVRASLKRYQSFIEVTGELGWTTNAAGEVLEDIPCFRNFTGQTYDEVKGWGWTKAVHPDDLEHATKAWQAAVAAKTPYEVEYRLRRRDDVYRNFMARGAPILEEDGQIREWVGTCIDITDRKEAEEKLANLKEFDERIIDSLDDALLVIDPDDYKIISTNEAALKQLKLRKEELIGKTCYETTHHTLTPCKPPEHDCPIRRVLETKETVTVEHKHFDENNTERIVEVSARLVKNPEGKPVVIHVARDVTERKKAEEALNGLMNRLVLVNEKLNVVGSLTRHDVRNKLSAVTANAFMIKKKHAGQSDIMDGLGKMEQAVKDVVKIFDFAKTYEELGVEELAYVDVEKTLNESVALFSGSLNIEVINDCHGLTVLADSFLRQLFFNLVDNSLKHGEKVTRIRVHYERVDQDTLNVVYEDDGVGISTVNKSKLFKEGFSTGGSSGYGLFLIRRMVEVYGWVIQENGEPDKGARFTITIPKLNKNGKENFQIEP